MGKTIQHQAVNTKLRVIFDWLEFTIHDLKVDEVIKDVLKLKTEDFVELKKGKMGYKKQQIWNNGTLFILYNSKVYTDEQGIHVILSGSGCRHYEKDHNIRDLIIRVSEKEKYKFTRIDLAIDDLSGKKINFDKFLKESNAENFSSKWYKFSSVMEKRIADGEYLGRTIYYGSKSSKIFMRVYDKYLEQKKKQEKHKDQISEPLKENVNWTRLEVVFKEGRAGLVASYIVQSDDVGKLIRGVLKNYIRFLKPNKSDSLKRRWSTATWWEKLIGDVEKIKLTIKPAEKSIDEMQKWVEKQISPTIAAITRANEGDMEWLIKMIIEGQTRLKPKHIQAINQHLNS